MFLCLALEMQVTVTRCKFSGFRRILDVYPGSQARFKDCVVDVAIQGSYGGGAKDNFVVGALCTYLAVAASKTGVGVTDVPASNAAMGSRVATRTLQLIKVCFVWSPMPL
jgi:hypothetical protein